MYEFYYPMSGVTQIKRLISHRVWEIYRTIENEKKAKKFLEFHTKGDEWFTDRSPLYDAIESGILECNGLYLCKVKKLEV